MVRPQMVWKSMDVCRDTTRVPLAGNLSLRFDVALGHMLNSLTWRMHGCCAILAITDPFTLVENWSMMSTATWLWRAYATMISASLT